MGLFRNWFKPKTAQETIEDIRIGIQHTYNGVSWPSQQSPYVNNPYVNNPYGNPYNPYHINDGLYRNKQNNILDKIFHINGKVLIFEYFDNNNVYGKEYSLDDLHDVYSYSYYGSLNANPSQRNYENKQTYKQVAFKIKRKRVGLDQSTDNIEKIYEGINRDLILKEDVIAVMNADTFMPARFLYIEYIDIDPPKKIIYHEEMEI